MIPQTVFWNNAYALGGGFDTVSKTRPLVESLEFWPVPGITIAGPKPMRYPQRLREVHDPAYVMRVLEGDGGEFGRAGRSSVVASTAGMINAAQAVLDGAQRSGSLSSGMHHAGFNYGSGFCTFNGLALAAHILLEGGLRVLVVDLDAHCGGGTWDIVGRWSHVGQVDVAVDVFDKYQPHRGRGLTATLDIVRHRSKYLGTVERALQSWAKLNGRPDAIIYNAGVDPFEGCDIGGLHGISAATLRARDRMVFDWADTTPVVWALAGGYVGPHCTPEQLTELHRATVEEAAR